MKRIMLILLGLAMVTSGAFASNTDDSSSGTGVSAGDTADKPNWLTTARGYADKKLTSGRHYFTADGEYGDVAWKRGLQGTGRALDAIGSTANLGYLGKDLVTGQDSLLNSGGLRALMKLIKQEEKLDKMQGWLNKGKGSRAKNAGLSFARAALVEALLSQLSQPGMYNKSAPKGRRSAFRLAKDGTVGAYGYAKDGVTGLYNKVKSQS